MIDGALVVDAVVHGFNFRRDNLRQPFLPPLVDMLYHLGFTQLMPQDDARYRLSRQEFEDLFDLQPAVMEEALFAESATDVAVYHGVPMYGLFGDGSSPIWVGEAIREAFPHRMHVYGDVSPWQPDPLARIDDLVDRHGVIGLKLYPADFVDGAPRALRMDDERAVFPLIERARAKGLRTIAVHKAVPLGPLPRDAYGVSDMAPALEAFPDMRFEIVHGGFAFAEETARLLARHENVAINLETNPCFAVNQAAIFAEMMAPLLAAGRNDRIFYATGATGMHPAPVAEAFLRFEMPRGFPPLSEADRRGMLGENFARFHGWDVDAIRRSCAADRYGWAKTLAAPWGPVRRARAAAAA